DQSSLFYLATAGRLMDVFHKEIADPGQSLTHYIRRSRGWIHFILGSRGGVRHRCSLFTPPSEYALPAHRDSLRYAEERLRPAHGDLGRLRAYFQDCDRLSGGVFSDRRQYRRGTQRSGAGAFGTGAHQPRIAVRCLQKDPAPELDSLYVRRNQSCHRSLRDGRHCSGICCRQRRAGLSRAASELQSGYRLCPGGVAYFGRSVLGSFLAGRDRTKKDRSLERRSSSGRRFVLKILRRMRMAVPQKQFSLWSPAIIAGAAIALISFTHSVSNAAETKTGTIRLDFIIGGKHAPWFVALEKGFYAKRGLTATIQAGSGSADTVRAIAAAAADFGFADMSTAIVARSRGTPIQTVAQFGYVPATVMWREDTAIKTLKDLEGKSWAISPGQAQWYLMPAYCRINKVDFKSIKIQETAAPLQPAALVAKKTDFIVMYRASNDEVAELAATKQGM